jgi:hypothetical protein
MENPKALIAMTSTPLLPAQVKAFNALRGGASMLGLIAGAGKSRVLIEYAQSLGARVIVVVAPAIAVTGVWPVEIRRWWPEASVVLLRDLRAGLQLPAGPVFVITSPDLLVASATARETLRQLAIDLLCIDEAHMDEGASGEADSVRLRHARTALPARDRNVRHLRAEPCRRAIQPSRGARP